MKKCRACKNLYRHYGQKVCLCQPCRRAYDRKYHASRSPEAKDRKKRLRRERIASLKKVVSQYKASLGCSRCQESDPVCLDFHHVGDKEIEISSAVRRGWSKDRIFKETEQCILLCANCHRKEHY